ncbi:hypothetical protein HYH03_001174 [Edaphochlamys debaryana]|uniref:DOT1 domain-containing protein n=1 Tax=Edaphochlamys debaryana TaxID=47281 RepID=A0A836C5N1_9CHLO|nr:hypothetical protein HYH03_001174 [Edaphochlamys debaryana]|eukprot:KAG2501386.1 hypothetical protein HYH03_001174 [Edaphochlamys debaryana]
MARGKGSGNTGGPAVDALYSLMQSFENKLGGGEGVEGLYGSITQGGMQKVLDCLRHNTGFNKSSKLVDIGAGLGRPLLHAMVTAGLEDVWGVELDSVKCNKATAFCGHVIENMALKGMIRADSRVPEIYCSSIEEVKSLDPATHAYSFWEGVPGTGKIAFGELFAKSKTLKAVAVVQRAVRGEEPAAMMREWGFGPVMLISAFPVSMSGSGRSFTAYVFSKVAPAAARLLANAALTAPPAHAGAQGAEREQQERKEGTDGAEPEEDVEDEIPTQKYTSPLGSPRKPEGEPGPSSPAKKACSGSVRQAPSVGTPPRSRNDGISAKGLKGPNQGEPQPASSQLPTEPRPAKPSKARKPAAQQQQKLTDSAPFSRRTKGDAAGKAPGKPAKAAAPASSENTAPSSSLGTRSSSRLAAIRAASELQGC